MPEQPTAASPSDGIELKPGDLIWIQLTPGVEAEAEVTRTTDSFAEYRWTERMRWSDHLTRGVSFRRLGRAHWPAHPTHSRGE